MKVIDLHYPTSYVNDCILNTVRVVTSYKLDKKQVNGYSRIWDGLSHIDFISEKANEENTRLHLTGRTVGRKLSESEEEQILDKFLQNLNSILNKEVIVSAEILNVDPYKPANITSGIIGLITLIIAIASIFYAVYALFL